VALLAGPALAAGPAQPSRQDLHGNWRLNEDLTARMREGERQQDGRPEGGIRVGGGRRGGGGMGGPRGPGGLPGGDDFGDPGRERPDDGSRPSFAGLNELTIEQADDKVTFTNAGGRQRVLWTDNRKIRDEQAPGGPQELRAKWDQNGSLIVEVTPDKGPRRTETWIVSNDRKLLYLTVELEGAGRPGAKIRRAYDAATAGEAKPPAPPSE
jgi:hypothetical protein